MGLVFLPSIIHALLFLSLFCPTTLGSKHPQFELRRLVLSPQEDGILIERRMSPTPVLEARQFNFESTTTKKSSKTQEAEATSSPAAATTTTAQGAAETSTSGDDSTGSSTGIDSASSPSDSSLPKAFDGGLGTNYTEQSCPKFLMDMVNNDTFSSCLPISVLLQNSMSFFSASRNASTLDSVLSASCNVVFQACSNVMSGYASTLRGDSACGEDYNRENPIVRQAYNGLVAYDTLYHASCLKGSPGADGKTSDYCYTNAVTNSSSPTDTYVYYIPLGLALPAGSMPTCSQCLKDTMGLFATAAANKSQPASLTYTDAAGRIDIQCGSNFVNQSVAGGGKSSSAPPPSGSSTSTIWVAVSMVLLFFLGVL